MAPATKTALWTGLLATFIILVVDPFITGHPWWAMTSLGREAIPLTIALGIPFVMWAMGSWILALLLRKHTHWFALSAIALTVFWTAVVPGLINAELLAEALLGEPSHGGGKTSILFYIWYVPCLASIVLWASHIIRWRRERRAARAQEIPAAETA